MKKVVSKIHIINAKGEVVGRLATKIVTILTGKNKPEYVSHLDMGDKVKVENASLMKFSGKKLEKNIFYRHTGYPSGLRSEKLRDVFKTDPANVLFRAVKNMLDKNKLRENRLKKLTIMN